MLACLDVFYIASDATAACILFEEWAARTAAGELVRRFSGVAEYEPGNFFRRELPCLVGTLSALPRLPDAVIIDGYVWLGDESKPGLGAHLFEALGRGTPVIGVAKSPFRGASAVEVVRGASKAPLHVTSAGVDPREAAERIRRMSGPYRIPDMLRLADRLCRTAALQAHD